MGLISQWTSRINQFFFFSRSAAAGFDATEAARRITAAYRVQIWLSMAIALALFTLLMLLTRLSIPMCFFAAVFVQWLGNTIAFAKAHRHAGEAITACADPLNASVPESQPVTIALTDRSAFTPTLMRLLFTAPLFAAAAWIGPMVVLKLTPGQFFAEIVANKADFISGVGSGMLSVSILLFVQLRYFSRHGSPMARFTAKGCVEMSWIGALAIALSTLSVPLHLVMTTPVRRSILGVVFLYLVLRLVYGWTNSKLFPPPQVERNGDQFWRWGLFYYNSADPTLFIQHRSGPGYTLNFANFFSWPLALLFVGDLVFLAVNHLHR
ncbi:MAG: hypothetical protein WBY53_11605 [Acidobacteriaceae bacterium]